MHRVVVVDVTARYVSTQGRDEGTCMHMHGTCAAELADLCLIIVP